MRDWTPLIIVAMPLALGLLDIGLYRLGGNEATISKVMLDASVRQPLVALSTAYSFGVLMGHFFFPTHADCAPPTYEVIARMVVVLSPTVYAMIIIGANDMATIAHKQALEQGGQTSLALYTTAAFIVGGFFGRLVLPQHILPQP